MHLDASVQREGNFYALINDESHYSLWPAFVGVPDGWTVVCGPAGRQSCLDHIEGNWTDMRSRSLVEQMERDKQVQATT
jgi:MbtH protein